MATKVLKVLSGFKAIKHLSSYHNLVRGALNNGLLPKKVSITCFWTIFSNCVELQLPCDQFNSFRLIQGKYFFYDEGGETEKQTAERRGGCPISINIQGLFGHGSEQPDLVEDIPDHCKGDPTRWFLPIQTLLSFYNSIYFRSCSAILKSSRAVQVYMMKGQNCVQSF